MSTRCIEDCLGMELLEEKLFTRHIRLEIPEGARVVIVDPYMIEIRDLVRAKPGVTALVRVRRPGWGKGDIDRFIKALI